MKKYLLSCFGALAIAAILLLLISAFIYDPCSILPYNDTAQGICSQIGDRIYDFQTLITGIIAIFVAWATIAQMRESDQKQNERFTHTLEIGIKKDALKVQKVYVPFWSALNESDEVLSAVNTKMKARSKTEDKLSILMGKTGLSEAIRSITSFVDSEQLMDVRELLSSNALLAAQTIGDKISILNLRYQYIIDCLDQESQEAGQEAYADRYHEYEFEWGESFENDLHKVHESIKAIIKELAVLRNEYGCYWSN